MMMTDKTSQKDRLEELLTDYESL